MSASPAAKRRASFPLHAYVGPNGGGKTLCMVYDSLRSLDAGRTVISTVPLYDIDGRPHPAYVPLTDFRQIVEARHADILMDEVTGVASSREHQSMPSQLVNKLVQLRRADVRVRWSTPWYTRADAVLREVTQAITICEGSFATSIESDDGLSAWRSNRLFRWVTYDARRIKDFDDLSGAKLKNADGKRVKPECSQWFYRSPNCRAASAYDTSEDVFRLTHLDESGRCIDCGGTRQRPRCSCAPATERALHSLAKVRHPQHQS
jgi:hypothetical protein